MGWSGGSSLFSDVWKEVRQYIIPLHHTEVVENLISAFERRDCDTIMECFSDDCPEVEQAYNNLHNEEE